MGFPGCSVVKKKKKKSACQCRTCRKLWFFPWVGKIPLEEEMATHSSILAWKVPRTEEPVGYSPRAQRESDMTEPQHGHTPSSVGIWLRVRV